MLRADRSLDSDAHPARLTRRQFAAIAAVTLVAISSPNTPSAWAASSAASEAPTASPATFTGPWAKFNSSVAEIQSLETSPENQQLLSDIKVGAAQMEAAYGLREERLDKVVDQIEKQAGSNPSFLDEWNKSVGGLDLKANDTAPFFVDRIALLDGKRELEEKVEYLKNTHITRPAADRAEAFEEMQVKIKNGADYLTQYTGEKAREGCKVQDPVIVMDPAIIPTDEGRLLFEQDTGILREELATLKVYGNVCSRYVLRRDQYGQVKEKTVFDIALGAFEPEKPVHSPFMYGLHSLSMDPKSEMGKLGRRVVLFHEAFGHGMSVFINPALANMLSEDQLVERATFELQLLNNPDWAAGDGSIPELFRRYPHIADVADYIENADPVDPDTFNGLIRRYPLRTLGSPVYAKLNSSEGGSVWKVDNMLDAIGANGKRTLKNTTKLENPEQVYASWEEFCGIYMPALQTDALSGNVRARVLWTGLGEYGKELGNDGILVDNVSTGMDRTGAGWEKRVNSLITNAIVYHLFLNGSINGQDLRSLFTTKERQELEKMVYDKRMLYRGELWADGVGYSHLFGTRLRENPYRDSLRHIASMIA